VGTKEWGEKKVRKKAKRDVDLMYKKKQPCDFVIERDKTKEREKEAKVHLCMRKRQRKSGCERKNEREGESEKE